MTQISSLSSAVRLFLMIIFNVCAVILAVDCARLLTLVKRDVTRVAYIVSMIAMTVFIAVVRTPLFSLSLLKYLLFYVSGYALIIPAVFSVICFSRTKKPVYFADMLFLLINTPPFFGITGWEYVYVVSVGYYFVRAVTFAVERVSFFMNEPGRYTIKEAFDWLSSGIVFANEYGQISFINEKMREVLSMLGLSEYSLTNAICARIESLVPDCGRRISASSVMLRIDEAYLVFSWSVSRNTVDQIVCRNVTEEEMLLLKIRESEEKERAIRSDLEKTLRDVESIETEKEVLRMKGNLHDVMAQRLSILHGIVNYDGFDDVDLCKIKELVRTMMAEMYGEAEISFGDRIHELIDSFALIGVSLKITGDIYLAESRAGIALKILRECTTNAVRHGRATVVLASLNRGVGGFSLVITDNGGSAKDVSYGNGITSMKYAVEGVGGSLEIATEPVYTVSAFLPD